VQKQKLTKVKIFNALKYALCGVNGARRTWSAISSSGWEYEFHVRVERIIQQSSYSIHERPGNSLCWGGQYWRRYGGGGGNIAYNKESVDVSYDIRIIEHGVAFRKLCPPPVSCFIGKRVVASFLLLAEMTSIYAGTWNEEQLGRGVVLRLLLS
jgi:hypothetical protein